jgi:acyl-coenzyme A thioesterase PaaI-like protein
MAPAAGERLVARGSVVKSGRTLSVAQAVVCAVKDGTSREAALLTATLMAMENREGVCD